MTKSSSRLTNTYCRKINIGNISCHCINSDGNWTCLPLPWNQIMGYDIKTGYGNIYLLIESRNKVSTKECAEAKHKTPNDTSAYILRSSSRNVIDSMNSWIIRIFYYSSSYNWRLLLLAPSRHIFKLILRWSFVVKSLWRSL